MNGGCSFTTLDDAYVFLLEAKSLPNVPSAAMRKQRCVRACILLSWVSVEDGIEAAIHFWKLKGKVFTTLPNSLKGRISAVLTAVSRPELDENEYSALRKIRNGLTHPRIDEPEPDLTVENATKTFEFCSSAVCAFMPYRVDWNH